MYQAIFKRHAELMKALANAKRLEVVHLLRQGKLTVSEMVKMLGLRQANLSQQLMVLRKIGVVAAQRRGKEIYYSLTHVNFARASDLLRIILLHRLGGQAAKAARQLKVVTDPVCGMKLTLAAAARHYRVRRRNYYFCGAGCANEFKKQHHG
jgi:ArsR family transcriptional regulator